MEKFDALGLEKALKRKIDSEMVLNENILFVCCGSLLWFFVPMENFSFALSVMYGGILLPPTCKINYVNMQHNYVNMRFIYIDMFSQY